jgi:hypothetical protein
MQHLRPLLENEQKRENSRIEEDSSIDWAWLVQWATVCSWWSCIHHCIAHLQVGDPTMHVAETKSYVST